MPKMDKREKKKKKPKWIKVGEERFNEILSAITEAKNNGFKTNANGR